MSTGATLHNDPTPTISLTATFLSCVGGEGEIDVPELWASRVTDFMWLTIMSEFGGTERRYVDHFKTYLETIDRLGSAANTAVERERTRTTVLTPCFNSEDIVELLRMAEDTSISISSDSLEITTIEMKPTRWRLRPSTFLRNTTYLRKRTLTSLEATARKFLQKMPGLTALEFSKPFNWEEAVTKLEDAKSALEALKKLKDIGDDDSEVISELHEITSGLAEHMPPASAPRKSKSNHRIGT
ncbi:hypothetical protein EHS25_009241 [Saitozyma podzolica]|uniref:Uncharacterized protein n=1 Tax=Saitozyma podzolica TaxID=1890683 RepID=A0A427YLF2_9TREE|nr:hypothetical protein EHS25_009241 [Saitozyma podzolica]